MTKELKVERGGIRNAVLVVTINGRRAYNVYPEREPEHRIARLVVTDDGIPTSFFGRPRDIKIHWRAVPADGPTYRRVMRAVERFMAEEE
jgi:hypothetical protein